MAIQLKPLEQSAIKWSRRSQAAGADYTAGVANPRTDWAGAATGAKAAFEQGVQEAIGRDAFSKGVRSAGTGKWQVKSTQVGGPRYAPGVAAAQADYSSGFAPFAQVIGSISLPAKGSRGSPNNIERVRAIADALHAKRLSGAA